MKQPPWLDRTSALLALLDPPRSPQSSSSRNAFVPSSSMTLRVRKPASSQGSLTGSAVAGSASPDGKKAYPSRPGGEAADASSSPSSSPEPTPEATPTAVAKRLPRVILKVGPRPET